MKICSINPSLLCCVAPNSELLDLGVVWYSNFACEYSETDLCDSLLEMTRRLAHKSTLGTNNDSCGLAPCEAFGVNV